jgi:GTPase
LAEQQIGKITHYFDKIQVGVIEITDGDLSVGDSIRVGDEDTGFTQKVESIQVEHQPVETVKKGEAAGLKLSEPTQKGTPVYKLS